MAGGIWNRISPYAGVITLEPSAMKERVDAGTRGEWRFAYEEHIGGGDVVLLSHVEPPQFVIHLQ